MTHRRSIFSPPSSLPKAPGGDAPAAGMRPRRLLPALILSPLLALAAPIAFVGIAAGSIAAGCVWAASGCIRLYDRLTLGSQTRSSHDLEREVFDLRATAEIINLFHNGTENKPSRRPVGTGKFALSTTPVNDDRPLSNEDGPGDAA